MKKGTGHEAATKSMKAEVFAFVLGAFLLGCFYRADAQQPKKNFRIGFLGIQSATRWADRVNAFRQGLRELGYTEGENIQIEYRWADGHLERLPSLAAELVRLNVDLI